MSATLDWSYQLLSDAGQRVLRRLAIFAGGFTLQGAAAVATDATHPESEIIDQVAELVSKSLVAADVGGAEPRLRLLETTRLCPQQAHRERRSRCDWTTPRGVLSRRAGSCPGRQDVR
jgi:predicted ATPase